jgi:predicted dehydrogenase
MMTIRFIQVGVGVRGTHWAQVIRADPQAVVAAYVDLRLDVAQQKAVKWGQPDVPCFTDLAEALDSIEADAVLLVTPPAGHFEQTMLAFEHGYHVLCEKPLVEEMSEAIELVRQAKNRGLQLMVGMNFRYLPTSQAIRRFIREQRFGTPGYGHFVYLRNRDGRRHDLNDYPLTMEQPMLLEQSIHHLDLLRYCYGAEVEALTADTWRPSWSTYADDCCVSVLLRFEGGLHVNYIGTWTAGWNRFQFQWRTDCPQGTIIQKAQFDDLHSVEFQPHLAMEGNLFKEGEAEPLQPVPLETGKDFIDDTRGLLAEFVEAAQNKKPLDTSGRDHLKTLSLVLACIEAGQTSQWIKMQDFYHRQGIPVDLIKEKRA